MDRRIVRTSQLVAPKGATRIQSSAISFSSDYSPTSDYDAATKIYVDTHGGGGGASRPQVQMIYFSTAGAPVGTTPDGTTLSKAFTGITSALAAAVSHTPSVNNPYALYCEDAGIFEIGADLILPAYVSIYAPNISIVSDSATARTITVFNNCCVTVANLGSAAANINITWDSETLAENVGLSHVRCNTARSNILCSNSGATVVQGLFVADMLLMGDLSFAGPGPTYGVMASRFVGTFHVTSPTGSLEFISNDITLNAACVLSSSARMHLKYDSIVGIQNITVSNDAHLFISDPNINITDNTTPWLTSTSTVATVYLQPYHFVGALDFQVSTFATDHQSVTAFTQRLQDTIDIEIPVFKLAITTSDGKIVQSLATILPTPLLCEVSDVLAPCMVYNSGGGPGSPSYVTVNTTTFTNRISFSLTSGNDFVTGWTYVIGPTLITASL